MDDTQLIASEDHPKIIMGTIETNEAFDALLEFLRILNDDDGDITFTLSGAPLPQPEPE